MHTRKTFLSYIIHKLIYIRTVRYHNDDKALSENTVPFSRFKLLNGSVHIRNTSLSYIILRFILIRIEREYHNGKTLFQNTVQFLTQYSNSRLPIKLRDILIISPIYSIVIHIIF